MTRFPVLLQGTSHEEQEAVLRILSQVHVDNTTEEDISDQDQVRRHLQLRPGCACLRNMLGLVAIVASKGGFILSTAASNANNNGRRRLGVWQTFSFWSLSFRIVLCLVGKKHDTRSRARTRSRLFIDDTPETKEKKETIFYSRTAVLQSGQSVFVCVCVCVSSLSLSLSLASWRYGM